MRTFIVRTNCEYSTEVTVRDDQDENDAIAVAEQRDVADWDQAWAEAEAEAT